MAEVVDARIPGGVGLDEGLRGHGGQLDVFGPKASRFGLAYLGGVRVRTSRINI